MILRILLCAVASFALGVLTSLGQGSAWSWVAQASNSAAAWLVVAAACAATTRGVRTGATVGAGSLVLLLVGYGVASEVRGYAVGTALVAFWGLAAVVVGPVAGGLVGAGRAGDRRATVAAVGVLAGVLVGEGVHGLTAVADSTSPAWPITELAAGAALLALPGRGRPVVVAAVIAALVAAGFVVLYGLDLIALF